MHRENKSTILTLFSMGGGGGHYALIGFSYATSKRFALGK